MERYICTRKCRLIMSKRAKKEKGQKGSFKKAKRIFSFMKPYRPTFAVGFIFLVLSSFTGMLFPYLLGQLLGKSGGDSTNFLSKLHLTDVHHVVIALFCVFAAQSIFSFFRIYLFSLVTEGTLRDVRAAAFGQLITSPINFFNKNKVGELTSRIATDINQVQTTINTTLAEFVRQIITIVVGIAALLWLSGKLALIMLSIIPVVALLAVFFGRFIRKLSKQAQNSAAESNNILEEVLTGISNVKAYTNEWLEIARYRKAIQEIRSLSVKGALWRGLFASFVIFAIFGSITIVIWQGVLLTESSGLSQGNFFSFIMYTIFLGASIGSLPDLYSGIQKALGATENLMDILEEPVEKVFKNQLDHRTPFNGSVKFKDVSFFYETRPDVKVLENLNFNVEPGQQIAIVGPSGAGKTTIASLLLRFYDPVSGQILVDNKPAGDYELSDYRANFAVVPQEVILFGGSIGENIAYGKPDATPEEIKEAARKANCLEFINKFPKKLDTLVGERGIQLSGGQRQRIAIARAILRDPSILILDEATSSLDSESERLVQEALEVLMRDRTSFVIAHRLSTIRKADIILVIENGKLKEMGTHSELLIQSDGLYKQLLEMQQFYEVEE